MNSIEELLQKSQAQNILIVLGITLILWLASIVFKRFTNAKIEATDNKYRARKVINAAFYFGLILTILIVYRKNIGDVGVALGVAGAGIAFALQEVIISIAGWVSISLSSTVRVGQRVQIGGIKGDIVDIGLLKTTVMEMGGWINGDLYNGRLVSVANSFVFKEPVYNYSGEFPFLWDEITIPMRFETDIALAMKTFNEVLDEICGKYSNDSLAIWKTLTTKYMVEDARVKPLLTMSFDENWLTFTARFVVDVKARRSTKHQLSLAILKAIEQHNDKLFIAASTLEVTVTK